MIRLIAHAALLVATLTVPPATPSAPTEPWDLALAPPGEPGRPFVLEGHVVADSGAHALRDVRIHVYHADARGDYVRPGERGNHLDGFLRTNVLGAYRIRTVLPGNAEGVPHIHLELETRRHAYYAITLSLCRKQGAGSDTAYAQLPWMMTGTDVGAWGVVLPAGDGGYHCRWDLSLAQAARIERPGAFARPPRPAGDATR